MIYIAIGSNLGDRHQNLERAIGLLKKRYFPNLHSSKILETEAIVPEGAPSEWSTPYLNMLVWGQCDIEPYELLRALQRIESEIGRPEVRDKWAPRIIDLDIILWDGISMNEPELKIPHHELQNRPFWLQLLKEAMQAKLVGIVNITPDSFSDGGLYNSPINAITRALELAQDGANIIELGAQSTRPGATLIGHRDEIDLLRPVLDGLAGSGINLSVDSFEPEVIDMILRNYDDVKWINDVRGDLSKRTLSVIAEKGLDIVTMHSLAIPADKNICISDAAPPIETIMNWAKLKIEFLMGCGFHLDKIIVDPGIGFSKNPAQDIALLKEAGKLKRLGCRTMIGHSRKSFISSFSYSEAKDRDIETLAISDYLNDKTDYLRVHNIKDHVKFFRARGVVG
nr:dihydropteroate synthase [uncultured bacterium]